MRSSILVLFVPMVLSIDPLSFFTLSFLIEQFKGFLITKPFEYVGYTLLKPYLRRRRAEALKRIFWKEVLHINSKDFSSLSLGKPETDSETINVWPTYTKKPKPNFPCYEKGVEFTNALKNYKIKIKKTNAIQIQKSGIDFVLCDFDQVKDNYGSIKFGPANALGFEREAEIHKNFLALDELLRAYQKFVSTENSGNQNAYKISIDNSDVNSEKSAKHSTPELAQPTSFFNPFKSFFLKADDVKSERSEEESVDKNEQPDDILNKAIKIFESRCVHYEEGVNYEEFDKAVHVIKSNLKKDENMRNLNEAINQFNYETLKCFLSFTTKDYEPLQMYSLALKRIDKDIDHKILNRWLTEKNYELLKGYLSSLGSDIITRNASQSSNSILDLATKTGIIFRKNSRIVHKTMGAAFTVPYTGFKMASFYLGGVQRNINKIPDLKRKLYKVLFKSDEFFYLKEIEIEGGYKDVADNLLTSFFTEGGKKLFLKTRLTWQRYAAKWAKQFLKFHTSVASKDIILDIGFLLYALSASEYTKKNSEAYQTNVDYAGGYNSKAFHDLNFLFFRKRAIRFCLHETTNLYDIASIKLNNLSKFKECDEYKKFKKLLSILEHLKTMEEAIHGKSRSEFNSYIKSNQMQTFLQAFVNLKLFSAAAAFKDDSTRYPEIEFENGLNNLRNEINPEKLDEFNIIIEDAWERSPLEFHFAVLRALGLNSKHEHWYMLFRPMIMTLKEKDSLRLKGEDWPIISKFYKDFWRDFLNSLTSPLTRFASYAYRHGPTFSSTDKNVAVDPTNALNNARPSDVIITQSTEQVTL